VHMRNGLHSEYRSEQRCLYQVNRV
jgi:hypothetical protein